MALTNEEYQDVLRHFLMYVKKYDAVSYESVIKYVESDYVNPRTALLGCIKYYAHTVQASTKGTHGKILQLLNENVEGDVQGVKIILSPREQELYERKHVDLTPMVDKTEFVDALRSLCKMIEVERGQHFER